jgi:hypothetical protein
MELQYGRSAARRTIGWATVRARGREAQMRGLLLVCFTALIATACSSSSSSGDGDAGVADSGANDGSSSSADGSEGGWTDCASPRASKSCSKSVRREGETMSQKFDTFVISKDGVEKTTFKEFTTRGRVADCNCDMIVCVCIEARKHKDGCPYKVALLCPVSIECHEDGFDVCKICDACTCR